MRVIGMTMENFTKNITAEYILEAEPFRMILRPADPNRLVDIDEHDVRRRGFTLTKLQALELTEAQPLSWISGGRTKTGSERHIPALNSALDHYLSAREKLVPSAWSSKDHSRVLCDLLGPGFPKRWKVAMRYAFEQPLHEMLGSRVVRSTCLHWPRGVMNYNSLMFLVKYREKLQQIVKDGYWHFIPLIQQYWVWALKEDQPLQAIRATLGKGVWKMLCAQSVNRVLILARQAQVGWNAFNAFAAEEEREHWVKDLLTHAPHLPTTLLQAKDIIRVGVDELPYLVSLARRKPWVYGRDADLYIRTTHMWQYLRRELNDAVGMDWSPRRVAEEHRALVERERAAQQLRFLERRAKDNQPFDPPAWVPLGVTDYKSRLTARLLLNAEEYILQGQDQHHCVGSYARDGADNKAFVYSIEEADSPAEARAICSTVMYNAAGGMVQHYGKHNAIVKDQNVLDLVNQLTVMLKRQAPAPMLATANWDDMGADDIDF